MPRLPEPRRRTRILLVDGEVHVVVDRRRTGLRTRRLRGAQAAQVLHALDDVQYDLAARLTPRRRP